MRLFKLLFCLFFVCMACSPAQPSFEWDENLEQLKSEVLKKACTDKDRDFYEGLIADQSLDLNYEEMTRSLKNMESNIRCE